MAQDDDDLGARVRAARGYANLSQQGLADAIGVERRIVGYIEGNEPRHELTVPEARRIADACRIPARFLLNGWAAPPELEERVAALDAEVRRAAADRELLAAQIEALDARLETRFAELASQALGQSSPPPDAKDRSRPKGRKTR